MWINSVFQSFLAALVALTAIGAVILERISYNKFLVAQIMASAALIVDMRNAFS